jgi:4-amino-4-deoxy-L-arabinose transferase-like glycosyltransferase
VTRPDAGRLALALAAAVAIILPVATMRFIPTPFSDVQLYASIARARQLYGVGVPTITWNSPVAVDHVPFYGPVFFDLVAACVDLFGFSLVSFRLVSLLGTALYVLGTVMLAREFSGSPTGPLLAAVLVLLSPEINTAAATGAMHMLAIGFQVMAMAVFATKFDRRRDGAWRGGLAGLFLGLAALTTPRSYHFVFSFFCAGLIPALFATATKAVRYRLGAAFVTLAAIFLVWTTSSHGGPIAWTRYMAYIFSHEDTDVAVLATAVRNYSFHWSGLVTLTAVVVGSFVMARSVSTPGSGREEGPRAALVLLLACTWIQLVTTAVTLNYTFANSEYILLPAFAVLVSWPRARVRATVPHRIAAAAVLLLLAVDAGVLTRRYAFAAVTWDSLDPKYLDAFVTEHVPPGSTVVGPEAPFFFPVEKAGSRYRTIDARSWADWARWVPEVEPEALRVVARFPVEPTGARFLMWIDGADLPEGYECAGPHVVARFKSVLVVPDAPRWMQRAQELTPGYQSSTLYRLPPECPVGYDPTRPPASRLQFVPRTTATPPGGR